MFSGAPSASEILSNTLATTGTLVTVPAGRWYTGTISMSATVAVAGASNPVVTVNGTNAAPAAGTVVARLNLAGLALSTISGTTATDIIAKAPSSNAITIDFTAGANGVSSATVNGFTYG